MNEIPIDDLVPQEFRVLDDYKRICEKMKQNLCREDKLHRYATHEAGHFIYLERQGFFPTSADIIFNGPTIYYEDGEIRHFSAAVRSRLISLFDDRVYTEDYLKQLALIAAAGGVFERAQLGKDEDTDLGDGGDKYLLFQHCHKAMRQFGLPFLGYTLWYWAQQEVAADPLNTGTEIEQRLDLVRIGIRLRCFKS
jgi:hypothetical protein